MPQGIKLLLGILGIIVLGLALHFIKKPSPTKQTGNPGLVNAKIFLLRHAEKPDTGSQLSEKGQQRAKAYVAYFSNLASDKKISYIFASADSPQSERPRLTIAPTAEALGLKIDQSFRAKDVFDLAQELKRRSHGPQIIIVWHHGEIPALFEALGGDDAEEFWDKGKWPENDFNHVVEITFDEHGELYQATRKKVALLPGDKK